jgi:hypothetical protein
MTQPKIDGVGHGIPRMLYASDGSNWYAILVDSDGHVKIDVVSLPLPTDAATATNQTTMITALQLIDDLRNALGAVATDKILVASKSGDKIFGFESVINELDAFTLAAGSSIATSDAVPAGKVWCITGSSVINNTRAATSVYGGVMKGAVPIYLFSNPIGMGQYVPSCFTITFYLAATDKIFFQLGGGQDGDSIYISYSGVQMNAP